MNGYIAEWRTRALQAFHMRETALRNPDLSTLERRVHSIVGAMPLINHADDRLSGETNGVSFRLAPVPTTRPRWAPYTNALRIFGDCPNCHTRYWESRNLETLADVGEALYCRDSANNAHVAVCPSPVDEDDAEETE